MDYLKALTSLTERAGGLKALTGPQQLFFFLILLFVFLYGMSVGKTRALVALLAIYGAYTLNVLFPFFDAVKSFTQLKVDEYIIRMGAFLVIYTVVFVILNSSSLRNRFTTGELSLAKVSIISLLQIGFLASVLLSFVPVDVMPKTISYIYPYLGTQKALFFWAVASLIVLLFVRNKE